MYIPKDEQLLEVQRDYNKSVTNLKKELDSLGLIFERVLHNFEISLKENEDLIKQNENLKKQIEMLKPTLLPTKSPFIDEDEEEYNEQDDKVFNDWKDSFRRNLELAAKIYESWTPEQKIYNSIGYPKQNYDEIPDEYKAYYERN